MTKENSTLDMSFRDQVATMDNTGKRRWVYPKKPKGNYTNYRTYLGYILLIFLFIAPFLHYFTPLRHQFLLFNVVDRKFSIFGFVFFPQDFYLFALSGITSLVFIILFTVVYGRLFCGWICPQTIFMEMIFRKIEYAIEGDRNKQMKLDRQEWNQEKVLKRCLKWFIYMLISFLIANIFLCYILGTEVVMQYVTDGPLKHLELFTGLLIFTALFYFVFAWFREQVCTLVCPYGRLQGVLSDKDTITVAYDYVRGEGTAGRAKFRKNVDRKATGIGDCIDCDQCVVVCPTGIDIRNGTQLECINCTVCMDACDEVMLKIGTPTKLIRYASDYSIKHNTKPRFTFRSKAYTVVLILLVGGLIGILGLRSDYEFDIFHERGANYKFEIQDDYIVNYYEYSFINKSSEPIEIKLRLAEPAGIVSIVGKQGNKMNLLPEKEQKGKVRIKVKKARLLGINELKLEIQKTKNKEVITTKMLNYSKP